MGENNFQKKRSKGKKSSCPENSGIGSHDEAEVPKDDEISEGRDLLCKRKKWPREKNRSAGNSNGEKLNKLLINQKKETEN